MSGIWGSSSELLKSMLKRSKTHPLENTIHFPVLNNLIDLCDVNSSIVDLGCGSADVGRVYHNRKYLGMDLSIIIDEVSKIKNPSLNYRYFDINKELPSETKEYDIILMNAFLSEMSNPIDVLKKILKLSNKYIIIHRQDFTDESTHLKSYKSYCNLITTNSYINLKEFKQLINSFNYNIKLKVSSNLDGKESVLLVNTKNNLND